MACKCGKDKCDCSHDLIPDKEAYQINKRRMCYIALGLMAVTTLAVVYEPSRMSEAESIIMAMYLSLSGLVGAYFGFSSRK